jgi:hypothetical protein
MRCLTNKAKHDPNGKHSFAIGQAVNCEAQECLQDECDHVDLDETEVVLNGAQRYTRN